MAKRIVLCLTDSYQICLAVAGVGTERSPFQTVAPTFYPNSSGEQIYVPEP